MRKFCRSSNKISSLLLTTAILFPLSALAQTAPAPHELPTGGQVVAGQANISQSGAAMNIDQTTHRAAIDWQSFDIGANAQVNFNQPGRDSVVLNRVLNGNPTQIFGRLTANGQVFITNARGVYFAPGASVNVGGLAATTHDISNEDFMAGRDRFIRNGADGAVVNEGTIETDLGGYIALLAPEVRNEGVIIAQAGTIALAGGEAFELHFGAQGGLADITVTPSSINALVENRQAVLAPGGLIILSAQAVNTLQGGVVRNTGTIEAAGLVNDGGKVRLVASHGIELDGSINVDAVAHSTGNGGEVLAIASLDNYDSTMNFSGTISARAGDEGGNGGFVETSASNVTIADTAKVDTRAPAGETGDWLIDPYDYTVDASAATAIENSLDTSNVEVTTSANNAGQGSNGNNASTGDIVVNAAINSDSAYELTMTAANAITVNASMTAGALVLNAPGGITLDADISTLTDMTFNGNVTLAGNVTLTSGVSDTYNTYTSYVVPNGVTSVTATLVGGAGGEGGDDGGNQGGTAGSVGSLTASFDVTSGQTLYIAPGSGGGGGANSVGNAAGGAGGSNQFNLGNGGAGGTAGPTGSSGGGGGGGAATVLALSNSPTSASELLIAAGGGGGGGSGNNTACPGLCAAQSSANYRNDNNMTGQAGYNAGNQGTSIDDGGASGGGGGGLVGGVSNQSVFFVNEWTGRGGNAGQSGAANGFDTNSLSTSLLTTGAGQTGYAIVSYGGGLIDINGTVNGAHTLNVVARSSDVDISGAIGGGTALSALNITGSQGIVLSGGGVTTTGAQTYTGPLTLGANTNNFTTTSNGTVTFAGDVLKGAGVNSTMSVSSGSGAVAFNGQTGTSANPIGDLSVSSTGNTTIGGALYATSLAKTGSGKTTVSGGLIRTSGGQSYAGILDLGGDTTLNSTGTGNIILGGAVSNSNQSDLTINAAGGDVTLSGNLAVGTNDRPTPIGDVSITASGAVTLGSSGTPISVDAKSLSITADSATVHANTSTSFTCGTGASATGICLTDSASFTVASASTFAGPLRGTPTLTKAGAGKLTMTGTNTYTGNTTVSAGVLEIGGSGSLGGGTYNGNINVTGQVRFNNSVGQTLGGTMSGTGFINSPGSGVVAITTLSNADHYNLSTAYVVPVSNLSGSSSFYGDVPVITYQLATTAGGGTAVTDANPSGTATFTGVPASTAGIGTYTIGYGGGLTLGNERYASVLAGNDLSWTIAPRPVTIAVNKMYDGSPVFLRNFGISGMVNGDGVPTLSGTASVESAAAGNYTRFASSGLILNDANYTLEGASISATISPVTPVSTTPPPAPSVPQTNPAMPELTLTDPAPTNINTGADTTTTSPGPLTTASTSTGTPGSSSGITVSLVSEPSAQSGGVVSVTVPQDGAVRSQGFSFPLPEQVSFGGAADIVIRTAGGGPLPGWIQFNAETRSFTATSVPDGGLPLRIVILANGVETIVVISEQS